MLVIVENVPRFLVALLVSLFDSVIFVLLIGPSLMPKISVHLQDDADYLR